MWLCCLTPARAQGRGCPQSQVLGACLTLNCTSETIPMPPASPEGGVAKGMWLYDGWMLRQLPAQVQLWSRLGRPALPRHPPGNGGLQNSAALPLSCCRGLRVLEPQTLKPRAQGRGCALGCRGVEGR